MPDVRAASAAVAVASTDAVIAELSGALRLEDRSNEGVGGRIDRNVT
jgi:hypothetical protein